jgi:hypothetical protein
MPIKYRSASKSEKSWVVFIVLVTILAIAWPWYFLLAEKGIINKLSPFITSKLPFYISSIISLRLIYWYRKKHYKDDYTFKEFVISIPFVLLANYGYTAILFFWTTNLYDTEIWNGHVLRSEYYESWTEERESCTTDNDNNTTCTTYEVCHPPYWQVITNNNETVSISNKSYSSYTHWFGNEKFISLSHSGQVSYGDGNKYSCSFNQYPDKLVPTARSHVYVNYIRAAEPIFLYTGYASNYTKDLVEYPTVYKEKFGPIYIDRVISPNVSLTKNWKSTLNQLLCKELAYSGKEKQLNLLVYVTQRDTNFYKALHELWYGGKKNDVVVVLGSEKFPKLDWVKIMSWTDSKRFKKDLASRIKNMGDLSDPHAFANTIISQVRKSEAEGGYIRKPMAEFHKLRDDIHLPIKAYLLGFLLSLIIQIPLFCFFIFVRFE